MQVPEVIVFVLLGLLGGFTYILVEVAQKWDDLLIFSAFRRYAIGAIVGYLYHIAYSIWTVPNSIMCFVSGYSGVHFINALVRRYETLKKD